MVSGTVLTVVVSFDQVIVAAFIAETAQFKVPCLVLNGVQDNFDPTIAAMATLLVTPSHRALTDTNFALSRVPKKGFVVQ